MGDNGCSVGIVQYNACVHNGISGKRFLERYPEWKDARYQIDRMTEMVTERYFRLYDKDIFRTVVHHNSPVSAKENRDSPIGYWRHVLGRGELLTFLD